jgi:hypothetical protein
MRPISVYNVRPLRVGISGEGAGMKLGAGVRRRGAAFTVVCIAAMAAMTPGSATSLFDSQARAYHERVKTLHRSGHYAAAHAAAQEWQNAAGKFEKAKPGAETANALGVGAWEALFANLPELARAESERAMTLAPAALWIKTNYAHSLLFLGRTDEAIAAYGAHKGEIFDGKIKWEDAIRKDFADFRARGLAREEMTRVEEALAAGK